MGAWTDIANGEGGSSVRSKINAAMSELYSGIATITAVSANATANVAELTAVDATSGNITITAPAVAAGAAFMVLKSDSSANTVTIGSVVLRIQHASMVFRGIAGVWVPQRPGDIDERVRDVIGATLVAGTNMTVTVDDAGDTITLAAATPSSLAMPTGRWLTADYTAPIAGGAASSNNMIMLPLPIRSAITITSLCAAVTTLAAAGNFQLAIYAASATTNLGTGAPLWSSASQSTAAVATVTVTGQSIALTQGLYWVACNVDNSTAVFTCGEADRYLRALIGANATAQALAVIRQLAKSSVTFGTWPTLTGSYSGDGLSDASGSYRCPLVGFKA